MKRRDALLILASTSFWSIVAHAQQNEGLRTVGILLGSPAEQAQMRGLLDTFVQELRGLGWDEGRNLRLEVRWGGVDPQELSGVARALVSSQPDLIFAAPSNAVVAVQRETRNIPIVFANVSDPIAQRIVDNLARPTGNVTGFTYLEPSLMGKWLQILKEATPGLRRVGLMIWTGNAASPIWYRMFKEVAPMLAIEPLSLPVKDLAEIGSVIKSTAGEPHSAIILVGDTMLANPPVRKAIVETVASHRLPALYGDVAWVQDGGLMSYGIDAADPFRRAASYVNRILKGEKPSELPVQQPTKFNFVVNLKTARTLGLHLPPALVATADAVIE